MIVLVIAGSEELRLHCDEILVEAGHETVLAASASDAMLLMEQGAEGGESCAEGLCVVLVDRDLPDSDGIELCRRMRAMEQLSGVTMLLMDGALDEETLERAYGAGITDHVAKPVRRAELLRRMQLHADLKRHRSTVRHALHEQAEVTEKLESANRRLKETAYLDELTGMANRPQFEVAFDKEWRRAKRERYSLTLVLVDLDCLGAYNDLYGHQAGNRAIARVAEALTSVVKRPGDLIARYEGQRFAVLLPGTEPLDAARLAQRVRRAVLDLGIAHEDATADRVLTASAGLVSTTPTRELGRQEMVAACIDALVMAKDAGGNAVRVFP